jgi:hypothetical protein
MMTDYIDVKAKENCSMIVLDAFTGNFTAHRFVQSRVWPKRLSFCKIINEEGLS